MWSMTANVTNFESEIFKANHQRGRLSGSRGNLFWFERLFYRVECSFSCNSAEHGQAVDLPLCLIDLRFLNKFFPLIVMPYEMRRIRKRESGEN